MSKFNHFHQKLYKKMISIIVKNLKLFRILNNLFNKVLTIKIKEYHLLKIHYNINLLLVKNTKNH